MNDYEKKMIEQTTKASLLVELNGYFDVYTDISTGETNRVHLLKEVSLK